MRTVPSSPTPPKESAPPPPPRRRRTRSSSTSSLSSISSSPCPSEYSLTPTPFHPSSSSIPFSWEQSPGIPKSLPKTLTPLRNPSNLPLPPPLRSDSFASSSSSSSGHLDPFAAAIMECSKEDPPPEYDSDIWMAARSSSDTRSGRRRTGDRFGFGFGFGFGVLDLYGSCKTSCSVAESTIKIPRVGRPVAPYRILSRRIG